MRLARVRGSIAALMCAAVGGCGEETETPAPSEPEGDETAYDGVGSDDGFGPVGAPEGDAEGKADAPCAAATSIDPEFLHDPCHRKRQPSDPDRDWTCPVSFSSPSPPGLAGAYRPGTDSIVVEALALAGIVPAELKVTLVLVRRVGGVPYYRYLSNGTHADAFQPWSSSKFLAVANAAAQLRARSAGRVGITASTQNGTPLGDLVTVIHSYSEGRYTSNGCAAYFHDIGGRVNAQAMTHRAWLNRPASESFGGNYGAPPPALGCVFTEADGSRLSVTRDTVAGIPNHLSTLAMAEALKRLVLHREDAATRLPGIQWKDLRVLFYGPERSSLFPGRAGGMSADRAIYVQSAVDIAQVEQRSRGKWRIFGKLGNGDGEFVENSYACFPVLDASGRPVPDEGREFVLSARLASGGATLKARDARLERHLRAIIAKIMDGTLQ